MTRAIGDAVSSRTRSTRNPMRRALVLALWLALAPTAIRAEVSPADGAEAASAYQALDALARRTRARGDLPRWTQPDHAAVLGRLWNVRATLGAPPYRAADVRALLTIGERAGTVFKTYALFAPGTGTAANTLVYQDEIARAGAYLLHVQAAQLEALTDFVATLPPSQMTEARRAGLRQMRLGVVEQVTGLTLMLRSPGLHPGNRRLLLDALAANAATLASAAPPADRAAMTAQIDALLPGLPDPERETVQALKAAFARTDCTGLCAVDGR